MIIIINIHTAIVKKGTLILIRDKFPPFPSLLNVPLRLLVPIILWISVLYPLEGGRALIYEGHYRVT